jgi:hypothetical protein
MPLTQADLLRVLPAADDDFVQRKVGTWVNRTPAQVKVDLGITGATAASFVSIYKWGTEF